MSLECVLQVGTGTCSLIRCAMWRAPNHRVRWSLFIPARISLTVSHDFMHESCSELIFHENGQAHMSK
ncbi:hypothetical protein FIBSPDRAFT_200088 [Athelia psychrophila]|uniref:Uncharacterized protein n=1 Tax=Athelia psychrophila TaxID=1759441 RepID=A0A165ZNT7_9AGAM|nr:hypothetical protein FIBSPDRAFT_200088 [Fibularhizoctonia sp. CBS 109695]